MEKKIILVISATVLAAVVVSVILHSKWAESPSNLEEVHSMQPDKHKKPSKVGEYRCVKEDLLRCFNKFVKGNEFVNVEKDSVYGVIYIHIDTEKSRTYIQSEIYHERKWLSDGYYGIVNNLSIPFFLYGDHNDDLFTFERDTKLYILSARFLEKIQTGEENIYEIYDGAPSILFLFTEDKLYVLEESSLEFVPVSDDIRQPMFLSQIRENAIRNESQTELNDVIEYFTQCYYRLPVSKQELLDFINDWKKQDSVEFSYAPETFSSLADKNV